jgi:hypothetical protein
MSGGARTLALIAVIATLVMAATPANASAGVAGTMCNLAGWFSGIVGKVCTVASNPGRVLDAGKKLAGGHLGGAIGALTGSASKTVARAAGIAAVVAGVIGAAQYALKLTAKAIAAWSNPDLAAVWFSSSYWRMAAVAALLTVPFLFAAAIQAMLRSDVSLLMRSAFGYLPLGLLAVGVAAPLTGLLLAGSDEMSSIIASASGHAGAGFLDRVGGLGGLISLGSASAFVSFFIALFTIAAALTLWLELLIREAAVYVIVLMLPLFFAAMVWPARRIWAVRAVELLVALILSKFAIVAVLALGGIALGHAFIPGMGTFLAGTTLVLLAAFSPWAMLRLLPLHELAGAAAGGLRPHAAAAPLMTDSRAHGATDATENASSEATPRAASADADADAASEDVAAGLPARLRAVTQRDRMDDDAGTDDGARTADGPADTPAAQPDRAPEASAPASGPAPAPATAAPVPAPAPAPAPGAAALIPETDAFGSVVRHGELPEVFQNMSLDAEVLQLDQPLQVDGEAPALPVAPALAEPEDEPR